MSGDLETAKFVALSLVFLLALFFGFIPIKLRRWLLDNPKLSAKNSRIGLSCCVCFGAGVLFATVFLHIFPETLESFENLMEEGKINHYDYPLGEFIITMGFFLFYFFEEVIHSWVQHHPYETHDDTSHAKEVEIEAETPNFTRKRCDSIGSLGLVIGCKGCMHENGIAADIELSKDEKHTHTSKGIDVDVTKEATTLFKSIMVVAALSVHGCLEGLALGLEDTSSGVWLFCLAISLHKIAIAFSVGMELLEIGIKRHLYFIYIFGFSAAAPIGALVGTLLYQQISSSTNPAGPVIITVLQAISGGAILFVVFCEVLERERTKPVGRVPRTIALFFGYIVMSCLMLAPEPESEASTSGTSQPVFQSDSTTAFPHIR